MSALEVKKLGVQGNTHGWTCDAAPVACAQACILGDSCSRPKFITTVAHLSVIRMCYPYLVAYNRAGLVLQC